MVLGIVMTGVRLLLHVEGALELLVLVLPPPAAAAFVISQLLSAAHDVSPAGAVALCALLGRARFRRTPRRFLRITPQRPAPPVASGGDDEGKQ